tara:strand:+ start:139 stop:1332 length:1194 start_codon:yes stop_codon:yes gene_type:complete
MKKYNLIIPILIIFLAIQCSSEMEEDIQQVDNTSATNNATDSDTDNSSNDNSQTDDTASYNHKNMLINWVDNIILPSLDNFNSSLVVLKESTETFVNAPTSETFSKVKEDWLASFLKWQYVEMFDIGLAEEIYYKNRVNLYPANVSKIESNISDQNYDLDESVNFSSQGLNSIDYLLFGIGENEEEIILKYSNENFKYGKYLKDVVEKMIVLTTDVRSSWNTEFRESFINSTDNTATSSINKLVNDFIFYFEKGYRANKIGIPAGVFSDNPLPDRVEAYYGKNYSKILALEATEAIDNFFNGRSINDAETSDLSIRDYLDYMEAEKEEKLSEKINSQIIKIKDKLSELNTNFSQQITDENLQMLITYDVIQANVVFLKVDMLQSLNISVDYADADGD